MGLFDKLRGELVDIIEWVDDSQHTLVWRFPRYHNQIKNGAQLIVRPGQMAVFVHRGELADVFEPGHYELRTDNLPILSTLMGWAHGFDSPFKSEVYFVRTSQITDLKWGTPNPIMLRDADFGPVRLRAFGTYTLKAMDPRILLKEIVGTDGEFDADEVTELLRSIINSSFADMLGEKKVAALDLAAHYTEMGDDLRDVVNERIDDEYGLENHEHDDRECVAARSGRESPRHANEHGRHRRHEQVSGLSDGQRDPGSRRESCRRRSFRRNGPGHGIRHGQPFSWVVIR